MRRIIVEGLNAVGKTTLCNNLKSFFEKNNKSVTVKHGLEDSFSVLRANAYYKWNSFSSMLYYLASNIEVMKESQNFDYVVYDRSFLSTLTMFMSRDKNWKTPLKLLAILKETKHIRDDDIIILLKASEKTREKRIGSKNDIKAKEADLAELPFEKNKERAYNFLIKNFKDDENIFVLNNEFLTEQETLIAVLSFLKMKATL